MLCGESCAERCRIASAVAEREKSAPSGGKGAANQTWYFGQAGEDGLCGDVARNAHVHREAVEPTVSLLVIFGGWLSRLSTPRAALCDEKGHSFAGSYDLAVGWRYVVVGCGFGILGGSLNVRGARIELRAAR